MPFYRAQFAIENDSGAPRDRSVNTWHFSTNDTGTEHQRCQDITNALAAFYNDIDEYLAHTTDNARLKIYDLTDPPQRNALMDSVVLLSPAALNDTPYPNEVAACLSFKTNPYTGANRRRIRGRVYLGPLYRGAGTMGPHDARPTSAFRIACTGAADNRLLPVPSPLSGATITWSVFSRMNALGLPVGATPPEDNGYTSAQLVNGFTPVETVWMDDAFDTQRRRGVAATGRTTVVA